MKKAKLINYCNCKRNALKAKIKLKKTKLKVMWQLFSILPLTATCQEVTQGRSISEQITRVN